MEAADYRRTTYEVWELWRRAGSGGERSWLRR